MCQQLNLEDLTDEILLQLGIQKTSRISFDDFIKCRSQVCKLQFLYNRPLHGFGSNIVGPNKKNEILGRVGTHIFFS